ncbi:MAG: DNA translocase FtsK 4TM domain-containing protein [Selenomonadaceae bacterium]|nr:DNA translocase FtsK 4TM domain-containing protein [Selenomonadaceae bacterium]
MPRKRENKSVEQKKRRQDVTKSRRDGNKPNGRGYEISGIVIMAAAIICLCGLFNLNVGYVGLYFAKVCRYLFGIGVWPVLMLAVAWGWCTARNHELFPSKAKSFGMLFTLVAVLAILHHLFVPVNGELLPENISSGGGIIGGMSLFAIRKILGVTGGMIFHIALFVSGLIMVTGWSLSGGIRKTEDGIKKQREKLAKAREEAQLREREKAEENSPDKSASVLAAAPILGENGFTGSDDKKPELPPPLPMDFDTPIQHLDKTPEDDGKVEAAIKEAKAAINSEANDIFGSEGNGKRLYNQADEDDFEVTESVKNTVNDKVSYASYETAGYLGDYQEMTPNGPATIITRTKTAVERLQEKQYALKAESLIQRDENELSVADTKAEEAKEAKVEDIAVDETNDGAEGDSIYPNEALPGAEPEELSVTEPEPEKQEIPIMEYRNVVDDTVPDDGNLSDVTDSKAEAEIEVQPIVTPPELDELANKLGDIYDNNDSDETYDEPEAEECTDSVLLEVVEHGEPEEEAVNSNVVERPKYVMPKVTEILSKLNRNRSEDLRQEINNKAEILSKTMADFKVNAAIVNACHGPAVTRFEVSPAPGVKVSKITNLADDLALALAAVSVRIEPIPGKSAVGIEVPNAELEGVGLRDVLEHPEFAAAKSKLTCGIGMDISGEPVYADISAMPHLLVAGATGSGKSVCINTLITSILFKATPDEVKFILIDPKTVELSNYNGIPHLMIPVVTDMKKAASALNWAVQEMEKRYAKMAASGVRNMAGYNQIARNEGWDLLPSIVIIIDELADLMMVAPKDVEDAICRIAQKARAAGIHLVLATQRPSVDVITGIIKANIPSRISFAVSSQIDSRTILDASGAEKLLGKGDMLFSPVGTSKPKRVQGAFISDSEVEKLIDFIKSQGQEAEINQELVDFTENDKAQGDKEKAEPDDDWKDELLDKAVELVLSSGTASTSYIQRRLRIGYSRAARIIDMMEELGIIGPSVAGNKPREILMTMDEAREILNS